MTVDEVARLVKNLTPEQKARVVHVRHADIDTYIGRACREFHESKWHNPFRLVQESERKAVLRQYTTWLLEQKELLQDIAELKGHVLGCWCRRPGHDVLCHGLVLLAIAEHA